MSAIEKINNHKNKILNRSTVKIYKAAEIIDYINDFKEPRNLFERSFFQYKCNNKLFGVSKTTEKIRNFACFIPFIILFFRNGRAENNKRVSNILIAYVQYSQ